MKKALPFLAVAFSGFLVYLFDKIWGNSIDWEQFKSFKIGQFLTKNITVGQILIFIALFIALYLIGKRFLIGKNQYYNRKQQKLRNYNNSNIQEAGILMRWQVYFDSYGNPFIADLNAFCTKHDGPPIRFIHNRCPIQGCENSHNRFDEDGMKNAIESDLIDKYNR